MKKFPFLEKAQEGEPLLVLDIGSEAVKVLIFKKEGGKLFVLGYSSIYFDEIGPKIVSDIGDFERNNAKRIISDAIEEAEKNFIGTSEETVRKPTRALLGLPANIFKARVVSICLKRKKPRGIIKRDEEEEIMAEILEQAKQKILEKSVSSLGLLFRDIQFVELKILEIKIDGYIVPKLEGYSGENLDFRILAAFLPKHYLENFQKIIKELNLDFLGLIHSALGLSNFIGKIMPDGLFLDVGGNITQIFLLRNGKLKITDEVEIGGRIFSETISETFGISEKEARLLKNKYCDGLLSGGARSRLEEILSRPLQEWLLTLGSKLSTWKFMFSPYIFLFGGGSLLPEIIEIFERDSWNGMPLTANRRVKLLHPKDLDFIENKTRKLLSPEDIPALIICYGYA